MDPIVAAVQRRLAELGYSPGKADGLRGPNTDKALAAFGFDTLRKESAGAIRAPVVPAEWMPPAKMTRVICHWTAGAHKANAVDREHYHILIEGDGTLVRGKPSIALNQSPVKAGYAAHTRNCNGGSIGVSLCGMLGAREAPFSPGSAPITDAQWAKLALVVADLCERYGIPVTPQTVISHAEVQGSLGIAQAGKWDIAWLPGMERPGSPMAVGTKLRAAVAAALA